MLKATQPAHDSAKGFARYWDSAAQVPYLYSADTRVFVSYDDPESMMLKCRYVLRRHLAGIMFWDNESDPTGALLDTLNRTLLNRNPAADSTKTAPAQ